MFKLKDDVWSVSYGWGKVVTFDENKKTLFPVIVKFEIDIVIAYTWEGKFNTCGFRDLFFEEIPIPKSALERPRKTAEEMLKECEEVEFKVGGQNYSIYINFENNRVCRDVNIRCFTYGVKYISFDDTIKIIAECKENN